MMEGNSKTVGQIKLLGVTVPTAHLSRVHAYDIYNVIPFKSLRGPM